MTTAKSRAEQLRVVAAAPTGPVARRGLLRTRSAKLVLVALIGAVIVLVLPVWLPDPYVSDVAQRLQPPSAGHLFGTDQFGRDLLARVLVAARASWLVGLTTAVFAGLLGGIYGAAAAAFGGVADAVMMRLLEVVLAFPSLLLALVLAITVGPGFTTVIVVLTVVYAARVARLVRGLVGDQLRLEYVEAAWISGSSTLRILLRHVSINIAAPLAVYLVTVGAEAILVEAGLTYLGAGISPPTPAWGSQIADGQNLVFSGIWWVVLPSGIAIALTVLMCNRIADSIVDDLRTGGRDV